MNTALIFAGGAGQRMNTNAKPKQFLELHGKPIIIYTIEHFEKHMEIDNIIVVCLKSWIPELKRQLKRYEITKVIKIISGGDTGHESIYKGLKEIQGICSEKDIVLIHDGVRPLITQELISANIDKVKQFGNAITVEPATESVVISSDGEVIENVPLRNEVYTAKAPQSFWFGLVFEAYNKAKEDNLLTIDSAQLLNIYNYKLYTVPSTRNNIKITTPSDYYIFRALYEAMENSQIFGI